MSMTNTPPPKKEIPISQRVKKDLKLKTEEQVIAAMKVLEYTISCDIQRIKDDAKHSYKNSMVMGIVITVVFAIVAAMNLLVTPVRLQDWILSIAFLTIAVFNGWTTYKSHKVYKKFFKMVSQT